MNIVFVSNYYNHHQHPLCSALDRLTEGHFAFIATSRMREERRAMGYEMQSYPAYVYKTYENEEEKALCQRMILEADAVIVGSAPEELLTARKRAKKPILRYAERPLKNGPQPLKYLPRLIRWHLRNPRSVPFYLLSASAYTAHDYARFGLYRHRAFRFGYFPQTKEYDVEALLSKKEAGTIFFCARLIQLKHPEFLIGLALRLKQEGIPFDIRIAGDGEKREKLAAQIRENGLCDCVHLFGNLSRDEVRREMEKAEIFILPSDRREGWGAVLNEAMNSGCSVVASHMAGSSRFLIEHEKNGLIFESENEDDLYRQVRRLLTDAALRKQLGREAYHTVFSLWNAPVAAERLLSLCRAILDRRDPNELYTSGPCSPDPVYKDKWTLL